MSLSSAHCLPLYLGYNAKSTHQVEQHVSEVCPHSIGLRLVQVSRADDVRENTLVDVEVLWGKKYMKF